MNHPTKALALAAFALAGALFGTAAQASATTFTVDFNVKNNDASASMQRLTSPVPSGISNIIDPASAIAPGGTDPASGFATWSGTAPGLRSSVQVALTYGKADGTSQCTFTMKISHDTNSLPFLLEFFNGGLSRCAVPASARSADAQFTSQTYSLGWSS